MGDATTTTTTSTTTTSTPSNNDLFLPAAFNALSPSDHARHMRRAIALSREAGIVDRTGGCFGSVLVDSETGEVLGEGQNRVLETKDPTAHGEVCSLREACSRLGSPHLPKGSVCYASGEPCPMCHAALLWARCSKIFYGASYADVRKLGRFEDLDFAADIARRVEEKKKEEEEEKEEKELTTTTTTTPTTTGVTTTATTAKQQQPPLIEIEQMLREEAVVVWREYAALPDTERY